MQDFAGDAQSNYTAPRFNLIESQVESLRHSSAGRTGYSASLQLPPPEKARKTPMGTSGSIAMGLGGEDIVTDGASYIRIEQDIKEMQGLLPPLLETESTMQYFRNEELHEGRRESEEERRRVQAKLKEDSVPL